MDLPDINNGVLDMNERINHLCLLLLVTGKRKLLRGRKKKNTFVFISCGRISCQTDPRADRLSRKKLETKVWGNASTKLWIGMGRNNGLSSHLNTMKLRRGPPTVVFPWHRSNREVTRDSLSGSHYFSQVPSN